jgi:hypothetical protein
MGGTGFGTMIMASATDKYCTVQNVKDLLPKNIIPEGEVTSPNPRNPSPATLTTVDIESFISLACQRIDGALSTIYDVPLKRINQGGVVDYPYPIPYLAAIYATQMIFEQRLQGVDKDFSEAQKKREDWANNQLALVQNGEVRLIGQRNTRGNRFVRGTLPNIPHNPAVEGRSKGSGG